jgi:hypothetical protein
MKPARVAALIGNRALEARLAGAAAARAWFRRLSRLEAELRAGFAAVVEALAAAARGQDAVNESTEKAMKETFGSTCHGAGRVLSRHQAIKKAKGRAIWREMEDKHGKRRYTSPTHVVRAFAQALVELDEEAS